MGAFLCAYECSERTHPLRDSSNFKGGVLFTVAPSAYTSENLRRGTFENHTCEVLTIRSGDSRTRTNALLHAPVLPDATFCLSEYHLKIYAQTAPNRLQGRGVARSQMSRNRTPGSGDPESRSIKQDSNNFGMIQNSPETS